MSFDEIEIPKFTSKAFESIDTRVAAVSLK